MDMNKEYEEWYSHIEHLFETCESVYLIKTHKNNLSAKGFMEWIIKTKPDQYQFHREFIWNWQNIKIYFLEKDNDPMYYKYKISKIK